MNGDKELLVLSGARLYSLGVDLEAARGRLAELEEKGVSYSDGQMILAYNEYIELKMKWAALEKQHLELRKIVLENEK